MQENQQVLHNVLILSAVMNLHHLPLLRFIISVIPVVKGACMTITDRDT